MTRRYAAALTTAAACALGSTQTYAQFTGEFVLLQDNVVTIAGTGPTIDVWGFQVNNGSAFDIFTLEISFSGNFLNGPASTSATVGISEPAPGVFFAETWFTGNGQEIPITPSEIIDDGTELSGPVGIVGSPWIPAGASAVIAVFSVADGTTLGIENFNSAVATIDGQLIPLTPPEPATGALLALAIPAVARRRRRF
ncbi:MAG: PEP-CTERM sorting domain-containing protein [Planctomycetota bacterium]